MNAMHTQETGGLPDGRVNLNIAQLKLLRLALGMSQEALSESCANRRLPLSLASIKRAESGKPVLYRTARGLSTFFGVPLLGLVQRASVAPPAIDTVVRHACERMQCRAALDAALSTRSGRLIELHGPAGAGKSHLLSSCAVHARERGFRCIELRADKPGALVGALLESAHTGAENALPAGLDALLRRAAREQPLLIVVDDMSRGACTMAALVAQVLAPSLANRVSWMLACQDDWRAFVPGADENLHAIARTVFHLGAPAALTY